MIYLRTSSENKRNKCMYLLFCKERKKPVLLEILTSWHSIENIGRPFGRRLEVILPRQNYMLLSLINAPFETNYFTGCDFSKHNEIRDRCVYSYESMCGLKLFDTYHTIPGIKRWRKDKKIVGISFRFFINFVSLTLS